MRVAGGGSGPIRSRHPPPVTRHPPEGRSPLRPDGGIVAADGAGRPRAGRGVTADRPPAGPTEAS